MRRWIGRLVLLAMVCIVPQYRMIAGKSDKELSPIDRYVAEATARARKQQPASGSLYTPGGLLGEMARDLQARSVDDIVTIVVSDRASAVSRGVTATARSSSAKAAVSSLLLPNSLSTRLGGLANLSGDRSLDGEGETSRETQLTTTISARIVHVLPNGYLVVEGMKDIWINSEHQQVAVRGVVRWSDINASNQVSSDRLANLEVRVNGKGVVGDAIKRPNFLYRVLLGILPF